MPTTDFTPGTVVACTWLNEVDEVVFGLGTTTPGQGAGLVSLEDGRDVQTAIEDIAVEIAAVEADVVLTDAEVVKLQVANSDRNRITNGAFEINQRAVSGTVVLAAGAYGHDMWKGGAAGCTYTYAVVAGITTLTITAGTLVQVIEGLNIQTATYCLSWGGTAQGRFNLAGGYAASGITTAGTAGTNLSVEFGTGTLYHVQCEKGTTATGFDYRHVASEVGLCERYGQSAQFGYYDLTSSASARYVYVQLRTPMRATPTAGTPTTIATESNVSACTILPISNRAIRAEFTPTGAGGVLGARTVFLSAGL